MNINIKSGAGFTIIELIVVIAIIAILAAIVMVNVTQYIQKSKDSAVISDLAQVPIAAANYYYENGSLTDFCISIVNSQSPIYLKLIEISNGNGYRCNDASYATCGTNYCSSDQWALETYGYGNSKFCIDSAGFKGPSDGSIYHCSATACVCHSR